jgi:ATP-dependent HslUV protease subunit HslV
LRNFARTSGVYMLCRSQAVMLVVDKDVSLMVTGLGDVIEPPDGVMAIGSGGGFALGTLL